MEGLKGAIWDSVWLQRSRNVSEPLIQMTRYAGTVWKSDDSRSTALRWTSHTTREKLADKHRSRRSSQSLNILNQGSHFMNTVSNSSKCNQMSSAPNPDQASYCIVRLLYTPLLFYRLCSSRFANGTYLYRNKHRNYSSL